MKRLEIKNVISDLGYLTVGEHEIKEILSHRLARELAENFFKDLQLKKDNGDKIHTVEYFYKFYILDTKEYNDTIHSLQEITKYIKDRIKEKEDDYLLFLIDRLRNSLVPDRN